jgi:hypothetical protein
MYYDFKFLVSSIFLEHFGAQLITLQLQQQQQQRQQQAEQAAWQRERAKTRLLETWIQNAQRGDTLLKAIEECINIAKTDSMHGPGLIQLAHYLKPWRDWLLSKPAAQPVCRDRRQCADPTVEDMTFFPTQAMDSVGKVNQILKRRKEQAALAESARANVVSVGVDAGSIQQQQQQQQKHTNPSAAIAAGGVLAAVGSGLGVIAGRIQQPAGVLAGQQQQQQQLQVAAAAAGGGLAHHSNPTEQAAVAVPAYQSPAPAGFVAMTAVAPLPYDPPGFSSLMQALAGGGDTGAFTSTAAAVGAVRSQVTPAGIRVPQ